MWPKHSSPRRTFTWHSGGEILLEFEKRNVLGASMDFAEDITAANFNFEFTWILFLFQ